MLLKNFKLIKRIPIRNVRLNIKPTNKCFLYNFKKTGISSQELVNWLEGRLMDVYQFTGQFGAVRKCPWCGDSSFDDLAEHLDTHCKTIRDLNTKKLGQKAYSLLLKYTRENSYDVLGFYAIAECNDCIAPVSPDRKDKCELAKATRSRLRSLRVMGFECDGFKIEDCDWRTMAFVYKRRPIK